MLKRCLILCLLLCATTRAQTPTDNEFQQFVFFAVLEGLFQQGLPDATVDRLLQRDMQTGQPYLFVYACPICHPTYDALSLYRSRRPFYGDKGSRRDFAVQADPKMLARLNSDDPAVRADAFGDLVQTFIARKVASSRWSQAEAEAWGLKFEQAKQEGERHLQDYKAAKNSTYRWMKSCSMCRGASQGAKEKGAPRAPGASPDGP